MLVSCAGSVRCANVKYREEEKKKEAHLIGNAVANENGNGIWIDGACHLQGHFLA